MTDRLVPVAKVSDIPPGKAVVVDVEGEEVAVFNAGGTFYAMTNECPHEGGPLGHGWTDDGKTVTCPWHGWQFDLAGEPGAGPDGIWRFHVVVRGDDVCIEAVD